MTKILVTGGTGFLGTVLVERLLALGESDIRCLVRPGSNRTRLLAMAANYPDARMELFEGTLARIDSASAAVHGVDVIYHLAAGLRGAPADMYLSSVVASKNLLEGIIADRAVVRNWPKIVLVSSFGVYGVSLLPRRALVDEATPLEPHPERRDPYSQTKLRQERLFWDYSAKYGMPLVVLRPGVIYGPRGSAFSGRVGLNLGGLFLHLGGRNRLPLTFVENCVDAIIAAGRSPAAIGEAFNVHDDDLPTCGQYLAMYKKNVQRIRSVRIPYPLLRMISRLVEKYHVYSKGQLPAIFTPYKSAASWKGNRFTNAKVKSLGWTQRVPTREGLSRTFEYLRSQAQAER